jgi:hypothetical protein
MGETFVDDWVFTVTPHFAFMVKQIIQVSIDDCTCSIYQVKYYFVRYVLLAAVLVI